ncbi:hypothetical protein SEPCBS119000_003132 [Sporothrix epigloea]|uniref:Mitochondrial seryl-tRNA synthetase n=1 Tax=Sporothrix epigloea TaxID=1892477 RepID=A0ABP0DJZ1_9PEZI
MWFPRMLRLPKPGVRIAQAWRPSLYRNNQRPPAVRSYSTEPPHSPSPTSRAQRILSRLPPSMQKYTRQLKNAPVSHIAAFLILHELTAIVPLIGLFGLFHYAAGSGRLVPLDYMMQHYGGQVADGVRRFEKYFRRKEWFGFSRDDAEELSTTNGQEATAANVMDTWKSDSKYRIVVEVGLAYAITKVLLPVRIVASVWATPWLAGVLARVRAVLQSKKP